MFGGSVILVLLLSLFSRKVNGVFLRMAPACEEATEVQQEIQALKAALMIKYVQLAKLRAKCVTTSLDFPPGTPPHLRSSFFIDKPAIVNCDVQSPQSKPSCVKKFDSSRLEKSGFRLYLLTPEIKVGWRHAVRWCRSRGLRLATLENPAKLEEAREMLIRKNLSSSPVWTSGTNVARRDRSFVWEEDPLGALRVASPDLSVGTCLQLIADDSKSRLTPGPCTAPLPPLCELPPRCYATACHRTLNFGAKKGSAKVYLGGLTDKKSSREVGCMHDAQLIIDSCSPKTLPEGTPGRNGDPEETHEGEYVTACGAEFFFSSDQISVDDSVRSCCERGMRMATVDSLAKVECLAALFNGQTNYEANFWVGGHGVCGQADTFTWCYARRRFGPSAPWLPGDPCCKFKVEQCVQLVVSARRWGEPVVAGLRAISCANTGQQAAYLCERVLTNTSSSGSSSWTRRAELSRVGSPRTVYVDHGSHLTYKDTVRRRTSPRYLGCTKTISLCSIIANKSAVYNKEGQLIVDATEFTTVTACGRMYAVSKKSLPYKEVWNFCCKRGMYVAGFKSFKHMDCFIEAHRNEEQKSYLYYLSGMDERLDRNFSFCAKELYPVASDMWYPGNPNNARAEEPLVILQGYPSAMSGLIDFAATLNWPVVCEDPRNSELNSADLDAAAPPSPTTNPNPTTKPTSEASTPDTWVMA